MRKALICGVSGQDGAYLSALLLSKGYEVFGGSRNVDSNSFENLQRLNILPHVQLVTININDYQNTLEVISRIQPDEIYNLAGQSSVALSLQQPVKTIESIALGTLNVLEVIRLSKTPIKFFCAGSGECFGGTEQIGASEQTPFRPRSIYSTAKVMAFWATLNYRENYQLFTSTGILFNHESPIRGENFVTRKITVSTAKIAFGIEKCIFLGNLDAQRDWGHAKDYVEAMWLILQQEQADDFVIASGMNTSIRDFVKLSFAEIGVSLHFEGVGIDEKAIVVSCQNPKYKIPKGQTVVAVDPSFFRPTELNYSIGNPTKAHQLLKWCPKYNLKSLCAEMVNADLELLLSKNKV